MCKHISVAAVKRPALSYRYIAHKCGLSEDFARLVATSKLIDKERLSARSAACNCHAVFYGSHGVEQGVLIRPRAAPKPRVIGDINEHLCSR